MGFYAKDLDMPTCCDNCVMYDGWNCPYRHGVISRYIVPTNTTLPDFCGLVEVNAPHGRLIDADAFAKTIKDISIRQGYDKLTFDKNLTVDDVLDSVIVELNASGLEGSKNAPTVIESEE